MLSAQTALPPISDFLDQNLDEAQILTLFNQAPNWQERYRQIMLQGKQLNKLADKYKVGSAQIRGCESNAWLYHRMIDEKHYFLADSDARIVKGLIALLLSACNGKTCDELDNFDVVEYFDKLGLTGQLSPSRTNGLYAMAQSIETVI